MKRRLVFIACALSTAAFGQWGNNNMENVNIRISGGGGDQASCTIKVKVDDTAEFMIFGTQLSMRTLSGQRAQLVMAECTEPLGSNPQDFRFRGVDGRGEVTLVQQPTNRQGAVVRIRDSQGGQEEYHFRLEWKRGTGSSGGWGNNNSGGWGNSGNSNSNSGWGSGNNNSGGWGSGGNSGMRNSGNSGWGSGWQNDVGFRGDGNGTFSRQGNSDAQARQVDCRINRNGNVSLDFMVEGWQRVSFRGNVTNVRGNRVTANLSTQGGEAQGVAIFNVANGRDVERISLRGNASSQSFRLEWRAN